MAGYSVARCVNYCKIIYENYQVFRHVKSFGGVRLVDLRNVGKHYLKKEGCGILVKKE